VRDEGRSTARESASIPIVRKWEECRLQHASTSAPVDPAPCRCILGSDFPLPPQTSVCMHLVPTPLPARIRVKPIMLSLAKHGLLMLLYPSLRGLRTI